MGSQRLGNTQNEYTARVAFKKWNNKIVSRRTEGVFNLVFKLWKLTSTWWVQGKLLSKHSNQTFGRVPKKFLCKLWSASSKKGKKDQCVRGLVRRNALLILLFIVSDVASKFENENWNPVEVSRAKATGGSIPESCSRHHWVLARWSLFLLRLLLPLVDWNKLLTYVNSLTASSNVTQGVFEWRWSKLVWLHPIG